MTENTLPIDENPAAAVGKEPVQPPKRKRSFLGWFVGVLMLLLVAAGGAGYWGYGMWQQQHAALVALQSQVAELDQGLHAQLKQRASSSELSRLAEDTRGTQQALQLAVATLQTTLDEHKQRLDSLNQMLGQDANQWRLSEIERLLTAAQLRMGALDDPLGARQVLREVERLASTLGGESLALRTAVQQLAGALDRSVPLDRDGLALKMFHLAQIMPNLPLKAGEVPNDPSVTQEAQADWWAQTKTWFGSWMQVKNTAQSTPVPRAGDQPAPLAEATQTLLRAREALLTRHVDEAYRLSAQALTQAQQAKALDSGSPKVQQALAELRDISAALERGYRLQPLDFAPAFVSLR
ncbi:MAG: uroporphyrinogen-III C-methyltransferase, partial [Halothiobacillaceae bacterium]|nr:uroporphyrinogen-III C-methyltransferase [Halothiobacillaceae bacterium]